MKDTNVFSDDTQLEDNEVIQTEKSATDQEIPGVVDDEENVEKPPVVADSFNPAEFQLNYRGQVITPKDKDELVKLAQMGYSYSDSMAMVKQEKQRIAELESQYKPYKALDERFKQDPRFQEFLSNAINEYNEKGQPQTDPLLKNLLGRLDQMETFKNQQEQQAADGELQREIQELRAAYPTEQWDVVEGDGTFMQHLLRHAYENNITSLRSAYRDLAFDKVVNNTKAETLKQAEAKKAAAIKAGKVGGNSSSNAPLNTADYSPDDSYNDLKAKALAMLR